MDKTSIYREKVHKQVTDESTSALKRYQKVVIGTTRLGFLLHYELIILLTGGLPGALGLFLRKKFYPSLLQKVGRGTIFGQNVVLRYPKNIVIGNHGVIDDGCILDARGETNRGIIIGNNIMLAHNTVLGCKNGDIRIGDNVGIGANSMIHAIDQSGVSIGNNVAIGAYTYLIGGSHYFTTRTDIPVSQQGWDLKGGIQIDDNVWLGARVIVLDGVNIGRDAIVGAGAVVTQNIPAFAIAVGVPARVIGTREQWNPAQEIHSLQQEPE